MVITVEGNNKNQRLAVAVLVSAGFAMEARSRDNELLRCMMVAESLLRLVRQKRQIAYLSGRVVGRAQPRDDIDGN